jgi:integral membrane sensor domain MASE1
VHPQSEIKAVSKTLSSFVGTCMPARFPTGLHLVFLFIVKLTNTEVIAFLSEGAGVLQIAWRTKQDGSCLTGRQAR